MPLSTTEKTTLQQSAAQLSQQIDALVVDTVDIPALQAQIVALTNERDSLRAKIAAAQAALA